MTERWREGTGRAGCERGREGTGRPGPVLILGGTGEARLLAARAGIGRVITSLAGRVADPLLPPGEVRVGGFGGADGLAAWLVAERVTAVVDATHPFAARITANAVAATTAAGVPLLVLRRPGWTEAPGDRWVRVRSLGAAADALAGLGERVLLTIGRQGVGAFARADRHWFLVRAIEPPVPPLPRRMDLLLTRGPYPVDSETELMRRHRIDVVVSKDSGGAATVGKLVAARRLGLPVVLVDRPSAPAGVPVVTTLDAATDWLASVAVTRGAV